ncbi:MAG: ABC transporter permease [Myxococcaceae bacterium]|nr:ABC transporter permease [Myxococcaceae bacterium]MBH2005989.1 ABC transporter permease [Myxococcaceae bacterium]
MSKLLSISWVLFGATFLVTLLLHVIPGNPVDSILGEQASESARQKLSYDLGLTSLEGHPLSIPEQYILFVRRVATNELKSFRTHEPVFDRIRARLPYTLILAFASMLIALTMGPFLGILAAWRKERWPDYAIRFLALLGLSLPKFFLAPLLLLAFSIYWPIFPISGASDGMASLLLPAFSLGLTMAAVQMRFTRASILEVSHQDYIRTARAKGLSEWSVYFKHALRNALIPIVTIVGLELGSLLAGAVVVEKIFGWPGIGLLLLESIQQLDVPMVQGTVLLIAFSYVLLNLLTDWVYALIDPRVRVAEREP